MNTATTSYKHNGVPVSIPKGSYGVVLLPERIYEYPNVLAAGYIPAAILILKLWMCLCESRGTVSVYHL